MLGAIIGDVVGSIYEGDNIKNKNFVFLKEECHFTDDTVLTVATMDCLLNGGDYSEYYANYYRRYPEAGFGGYFSVWGLLDDREPYNSFGNGSAMRVGPVAWMGESLDAVLKEAERSAAVTHDHPEGIKGAQAVAAAGFMIRRGYTRQAIREYIESTFDYDLNFTLDDIRDDYEFDVTCQGSVPQALVAWLESTSVEDAVRNAVSIGGDSDTIACIAGSIAEAEFGVPVELQDKILEYLDEPLRRVVVMFYKEVLGRDI